MEESLDLILAAFLEAGGEQNPHIILGRIPEFQNQLQPIELVEYLTDEGYLTIPRQGFILRSISPKGKFLIQNGGFSKIKAEQEESRTVAKSSLKYAKWSYRAALWIGVVGIATALLIYFLSK